MAWSREFQEIKVKI